METEATKGQFAALIGVSPGRVSQMISEGKISGDALIGEGRNARINVALAKAQIRAKTDIGQSLGNGLATRVYETPAPPVAPVASAPAAPTIDDELRKERLTQIRFQNRKASEEERERQGLYVRADQVRAEMTRVAVQMLTIFDGSFVDLANAISGKFNIPQRDVLHLLREAGRDVRTKAAEAAKKKAVELPATFADTVADATDDPAGQA